MLTIIRIEIQGKEDLHSLEMIGNKMNCVRPGVFKGIRKRGDGFSCDVSTSSDWMDHDLSALEFMKQFASHITEARSIGAVVTMDMALDFADFKKPIEGVHFSPELLRILGEVDVSLEITVYTGLEF